MGEKNKHDVLTSTVLRQNAKRITGGEDSGKRCKDALLHELKMLQIE